jgi:sugar-specific transcriptional regulator TrmB
MAAERTRRFAPNRNRRMIVSMAGRGYVDAAGGDSAGRLDVLGIGAVEERLYRALLADPRAHLADLAATAGVSLARARQAARVLERSGMLSPRSGRPGGFVPAPPDVAVAALISRRHQDLEQARLYAEQLLDDFRAGSRFEQTAQLFEVINDPQAIGRRAEQLMRGAHEEVLIFDKPPYLGSLDNPDEYDALARGVRWRAVYSVESLDVPDQLARLERLHRAGERARVSADVPIKLVVADRRLALLPVAIDEPSAVNTAILVHPGSLLVALVMLFDSVWERGLRPNLSAAGPLSSEADKTDHSILPLLAAGMKDEAIARQLGVSLRTVRRWISGLMSDYGVVTRFQLGVAAARVANSDEDET